MTEKQIKKVAKKFLKGVKGEINFDTCEAYINTQGYKVFFFNTPNGDKEIYRYALTERASQVKAFAYRGTAKLIFIDANSSAEDKLYLLLHEIGHILLGHLEIKLSARSGILCDIDASTFAHCVLNPVKKSGRYVAIAAAVCVLLSAACVFHAPASAPQEYNVYITATGAKYHRNNCIHIRDAKFASIEKSEAEKLFDPCSVCNP